MRDQASCIERNRDVMDTECVNVTSSNNLEVDEQTNMVIIRLRLAARQNVITMKNHNPPSNQYR